MAATTTTPPPIQAPTAKEKKYDRQLRLWAASGQQALEGSHVLLVVSGNNDGSSGSSVAGVETLKNLVLPSIGQFTIADSATVTEADLGINFFLRLQSLGQSRAEECKQLLEELNPDVKGHAVITVCSLSSGRDGCIANVEQPLSHLLKDPSCLRPYNLIILCARLPPKQRRTICEYAQQHSISVIHIQSAGFYSSFSLQLPSVFPIVDTHPDPDSIQDLRLLSPWPELLDEVKALGDLDKLEDQDHGHVPYLLILLYYLEKWKQNNDGKAPDTFKEKTQFRDVVRAAARTTNAEGGEENFDEAAAAVLKTVTPFSMNGGCREMFEKDSCGNLMADSANFWIIAAAIKSFYEKHGILPLPGSLPDMKAKSADYIKLQNIYKSKARNDVAEVTRSVRASEKGLGRQTMIPDGEIEGFCKNAAHVKVLEGSLLPQLRIESGDVQTRKRVLSELQNDETLLPILLAFEDGERAQLDDIIANNDRIDLEALNNAFAEVDRVRGQELHNISSLTGGVVAQEAIKIITRQYVPVDNTCIFDGIKGTTLVLKL